MKVVLMVGKCNLCIGNRNNNRQEEEDEEALLIKSRKVSGAVTSRNRFHPFIHSMQQTI
jgi:hypothetical protein